MEEHPLVCYGDHHSLAKALSNRDIESFRRVLHSPTEIEKPEIGTSMTIFEQACYTPECAPFIEECILAGCDVNRLNTEMNRRPINFVADSQCVENLEALLRHPSVDVNSKAEAQLTPLNSFASQITDENFQQIFPCIKLLIQHRADINIPDWLEVTPILHILKNRKISDANKEMIIRYLLQNVNDIDIDTYRNGETRKLLQNKFPHIELMMTKTENKILDFNHLFLMLKNEKEDEFLESLKYVAENNPSKLHELFTASERRETLLIAAIEMDLVRAVEKIISLGADVNFFVDTTRDSLSPVKYACICGHWRSLELLLKSPELKLNGQFVLIITVKHLGEKPTKNRDYERCFDILLNHRNIDINEVDNFDQCSALHYAVKYNNSKAILKLLKHGAYIGMKNKHNLLSIWSINPQLLEKHFDSCITTNEPNTFQRIDNSFQQDDNSCRRGDDRFEIQFDYKNLIPVQHANNESITDEMTPIQYISKSKELRQLMMHPLIASFLSLKWNNLMLFFYINFFLCSIFAVTTVTYILIYYNYHESSTAKILLSLIIFLLTIYIAAREMFQFAFSPWAYLKCLENYMECTLIVLIMLILFDVSPERWRRAFGATAILFIAIEIFLLAGSLPFWSFSTHFVMLKSVTYSFLKSLSLYAIILLAFSLSFYILLHGDDSDGDFNKFSNIWLSIMKTLVMSTGEFDVASINFEINIFSYLVFMLFLFLVTIILLNLLNGLAVNDTQEVKSEAELTNFIRRSQVLARYECILATSFPTIFKIFPFCRYSNAFDQSKPIYCIRIKPNANNQILIPSSSVYEEMSQTDGNLQPLSCVHHICCFNQCTRMSPKIVKLTFRVLEKMSKEQQSENEKDEFERRLTKMETNLENISDNLSEVVNKLNNLNNL